MRLFITGTAGFIGFHLARRLLADGHAVTGYDGVTDYYDLALKRARLAELARASGFRRDRGHAGGCDAAGGVDCATAAAGHRGASRRAGGRALQPRAAAELYRAPTWSARPTCWRRCAPASRRICSSPRPARSMAATPRCRLPRPTGATRRFRSMRRPRRRARRWCIPMPICSASPSTCLRFFTVYGPWGRPDMALFKFVAAILEGRADRRLWRRQDAAGLHLCRRPRRGH